MNFAKFETLHLFFFYYRIIYGIHFCDLGYSSSLVWCDLLWLLYYFDSEFISFSGPNVENVWLYCKHSLLSESLFLDESYLFIACLLFDISASALAFSFNNLFWDLFYTVNNKLIFSYQNFMFWLIWLFITWSQVFLVTIYALKDC